ncbi:MAG: TrkH family potassium uptake protein [Alphaproteobacteria bacterium]
MRYVTCIISLCWLFLMGAGAMVLTACLGFLLGETNIAVAFLGGAVPAIFVAGATLFAMRGSPQRPARRDLILTPVVAWALVPLGACIPLLLIFPGMGVTHAYFETVSGLTTTGATILTNLDAIPKTVIFWRALLQWLGGFATIAMVIAVFPLLNIGGMSLFNNALPHGEGEAVTDRVRGVVRSLWSVYTGLTLICVLLLWLTGIPTFDGICLALSTISTGGFMPRDGSLLVYENPLAEVILIPFMLAGAINFSLHWAALNGRGINYWKDPEVKRMVRLSVIAGALMTIALGLGLGAGAGLAFWDSLRSGLFVAVSMLSTTGFMTGEEGAFPLSPALLVMPLIVLGGCTGSTAGGIKQMRIRILIKHGDREFARLTHPHGVVRKSYAGRVVSDDAMAAAWAFFIVFILAMCAATLILAATGLELHAAIAAATAAISNTGPALTLIDGTMPGYQVIADPGLWALSVAMILGRVDVLPLLILLSPIFWRG